MAEKRMTPEEKQSLLGLLPFSDQATLEYTPAPYKKKREDGTYAIPQKYWPVFTLRTMARKEIEELRQVSKTKQMDDDDLRHVLCKVVVGCSFDVAATTEKPIEYKAAEGGGADYDLFYKAVPAAALADLSIASMKMSGLVAAETLGLGS